MSGAKNTPSLSVIMPVYNVERYLRLALDSVLAQTFTDFELIIINDGSTDSTQAIIDSYDDQRIRALNQTNHRLVYTLNRGITEARGKYIARVDGDDICLPNRFEKQMEYISANPDTVVLGTLYQPIDETDAHMGDVAFAPIFDKDIRRIFCFGNAFGHGTVIFKRDAAKAVGMYRDSYGPCEDYDLWRRMAGLGGLHNLPINLYKYRFNSQGISALNQAAELRYRAQISAEIRDQGFPEYSIPELRIAFSSQEKMATDAHLPELMQNFQAEQFHLVKNLKATGSLKSACRLVLGLAIVKPRLAVAAVASLVR